MNASDLPRTDVGDASDCVKLLNVSRMFGDIAAVSSITLDIQRGEFFSLLGPSGCGKTTTLRMIAGFVRPTSGGIEIMGRNVVALPPNKRPVNTVFQSYALFSHLSVADNVAFSLKEKRMPRRQIRTAVDDALELVRLSGYQSRRPRELSGGEQQRVALARAIVNQPAVLLLDEPLGALDLKLRRAMQLELKALQQTLGMTFLYVTHDQEEALTMSDRIGVMERGRLAQVGTPETVYNQPANAYVADFVGEANAITGRVLEAASGVVSLDLWGQHLTARSDEDLMSGSQARLILRPEQIEILQPDAQTEPLLVGTVENIFFIGTHRKIEIRLANGQVVAALTPNRADSMGSLSPGSRVGLSWRREDTWVIPA